MSQENVEVVRRAFAFWGGFGGHMESDQIAVLMPDSALGEFLDPEAEFVPVPQGLLGGNSYKGYEGIRRFWVDFFSLWDDFRAELQSIVDMDPQVVSVARMRGRMHELEVDELWSHLWTFRDGRIARIQTFASADGALEAAGLRE
jgi:ketosteroid isomerase-like protein